MGIFSAYIIAYISTGPTDRAIATLKLTSLTLGIVGLCLAILLGILWSSQISRPVEELADFSARSPKANGTSR